MGFKFHEAANIFPLDKEHLDDLADDIQVHGLRIPIEVCDGKILDGRRRWKACELAGVEPDIIEVAPEDPVAYVLSLNLHRRHLTVSQAAMCAQRARAMYDKAAKERQKASGGDRKSDNAKSVVDNCPQPIDTGKARDKVGQVFGVSGGTVDRARRVIKDGIPEVAAAVDAGKISVSCAKHIATHPHNMQAQMLEVAVNKGGGKRSSKAQPSDPEPEPGGKVRGVGIQRAHEAIACLKQVPKNDALRKRGFQVVTDWIKHNK